MAASVVPEYAQSWDQAVEKRVVRKIDLILMPFMWIGYGLVYYDKVERTVTPIARIALGNIEGDQPHRPS